jgi:hypothetical protein
VTLNAERGVLMRNVQRANAKGNVKVRETPKDINSEEGK